MNAKTVDSLRNCLATFQLFHISNERLPRISYTEFYNDAVNREVDLKQEFSRWIRYRKSNSGQKYFSFINYPWILDSASKTLLLKLENSDQMRQEFQEAMIMNMLGGSRESPFLILEVSRDNLIQDTLSQLVSGSLNLKKPLKVHFKGEDGVDEGGLKKEFFQLIVKELFDPSYTMFNYYEGQRLFWFNPHTLEANVNFELIGVVVGLAIYNTVSIDINMPMVLYKKLQGIPTGLEDLAEFDPDVVNGLQQLLDIENIDEDILMRTFVVEAETFGNIVTTELKPGGSSIYITNENKEEYVQLFVDWWLNTGVQNQFESFKRGFLRVCGGEILKLFKHQELELMVCGSRVLDFYELERVTIYEDGYDQDSPTVKLFWSVIHSLSEEEKRKFLTFVTGCDRAPVNGLGSLRFVISRNGPDSDRLMTAHTCFNHLLLPEYSTEEKMRKMIVTAINNAQGFGLR